MAYDHTIVIDGSTAPDSSCAYRFSVSTTEIQKNDNYSIQSNDTIDGDTVTGSVGAGLDGFDFNGDLLLFEFTNGTPCDVLLDGNVIDPADYDGSTGDSGGVDGFTATLDYPDGSSETVEATLPSGSDSGQFSNGGLAVAIFAEDRIAALETDISSIQTELDGVSNSLSDLSGAADLLRSDVDANGADLSALDATVADLTGRVDTAEGNISGNSTAITSVEDAVASLEARVGSVETDMADARTRVDGLETDVTSNSGAIDSLDMTQADLENRLASVENTLAGLDDAGVAELDSRIGALEARADEMDEDYSAHKSKFQRLWDALGGLFSN